MIPERVVLIYDFASVNGGAAQVAVASAIELRRLGLQVDYFSAVGPIDPRLNLAGVNVVCLGQQDILNAPNRWQAATSGIWNSRAAISLGDFLAGVDPNTTLVHVHGWTKALSASIFPVIEKLGFRMVVTLHEYFTACPTGGFFDHASQTICERRAMSTSCLLASCDARSYTHKLWRVARQGVASAFTNVHGNLSDVIYISQLSRRLLEPYFESATRWHAVSNPIEMPARSRVRAEDNHNLLFIGRLSSEKGCELFCEAAAKAGVSATVVGDGPLRAELQRHWSQVNFLGWLDAQGVQAELLQARALVLPSLWYETQGLVVQEAMSFGVPALVADRTAARDAIVNGENGQLFSQGNVESLVTVMQTMVSNELVARLSKNCYASYWANPPTIEAHGRELLQVYERVMATANETCQ